MKITIREVVKEKDNFFVFFNSGAGDGFGEWRSSAIPQEGVSYFVELDIGSSLVWLDNISLSEDKEEAIHYSRDDRAVVIQGCVESIEDNGGRCFMRLDNGLFVFSCPDIPVNAGEYVKIKSRKVQVFDANL